MKYYINISNFYYLTTCLIVKYIKMSSSSSTSSSTPLASVNPSKKIIVLDLDKTITITHTGGHYTGTTHVIAKLLGTEERKEALKKVLTNTKSIGYKIYLCSRGELLCNYLALHDMGLLELFDGVYGSSNESFTLTDLSHVSINVLRFNKETEMTYPMKCSDWDHQKTRVLIEIAKLEGIELSSVHFFDDTYENVIVAQTAGISAVQVTAETLLDELYKIGGISKIATEPKAKEELKSDSSTSSIPDLPVMYDATLFFQGSVGKAIKYFEEHPEETRIMMIFSKSRQEWFANWNADAPRKFYCFKYK